MPQLSSEASDFNWLLGNFANRTPVSMCMWCRLPAPRSPPCGVPRRPADRPPRTAPVCCAQGCDRGAGTGRSGDPSAAPSTPGSSPPLASLAWPTLAGAGSTTTPAPRSHNWRR